MMILLKRHHISGATYLLSNISIVSCKIFGAPGAVVRAAASLRLQTAASISMKLFCRDCWTVFRLWCSQGGGPAPLSAFSASAASALRFEQIKDLELMFRPAGN